MRTFVLTRLDFIFRGARVAKRPLTELDKDVKRLVKKWFNLPQWASPKVVNLGLLEGVAGILLMADLVHISSVVHAFRLITCHNPVVKDLGRATLGTVVRGTLRWQPGGCGGLPVGEA